MLYLHDLAQCWVKHASGGGPCVDLLQLSLLLVETCQWKGFKCCIFMNKSDVGLNMSVKEVPVLYLHD